MFSGTADTGRTTSDPSTTCTSASGTHPTEGITCISGNEIVTDNNNDTCMALKTDVDNGLFRPLVNIASHCTQANGTVFLDLITTNNTQCSMIENRVHAEVVNVACENAVRLLPCKLLDGWSESTCVFGCQCKEDLPCQLWIEAGSEDHFNICEIIAVDTNKYNVSAS